MLEQSRLITIIAAVFKYEMRMIYIPFWELKWKDNEYILPEKYQGCNFDVIECMWDVKKQEVFLGIVKEIKYLPEYFKIGDTVLYSESHLKPGIISTIEDIVFEQYDSYVRKYKDIEPCYIKAFTQEECLDAKPKDIFELRVFKPWFKLATGDLVKYDMYLYKIKQD